MSEKETKEEEVITDPFSDQPMNVKPKVHKAGQDSVCVACEG